MSGWEAGRVLCVDVDVVSAPATTLSEVADMAASTVLVCPQAMLKAMRVAPKPLKDSVPPFAVEISGAHVVPPSAERRNPRPK